MPDGYAAGGWITTGSDGNLWAGGAQYGKYGDMLRITTSLHVTGFPLPPDITAVGQIITGPDGALWFTAPENNEIVRMTTAGTITNVYNVPTPNSKPTYLTAGPDGAIWFTEQAANNVGRLSLQGTFNEYPAPGPIPIRSGLPRGRTGRCTSF